ncbi:MAG TPA: c-type cytochrome [Vicinamibacterales bacterium]|nr:c-type cytochrome [Vicinamibacterales bacterium]
MRNVTAFVVAFGVAFGVAGFGLAGLAGLAAPSVSPVTVIEAAQSGVRQTTPALADSLAGRDSYELYCASCHGPGGRGDGPVAPALRTHPADLTVLSQRNNGAFPRERVRDFVTGTGRAPAAHGTTEMPIWGPMFRAFESDARVRERIENLVTHIESMQQASSGSSDAGAQAFRTYCASCHGTSARGDGPIGAHLRRAPPDLTRFTQRNGGVFPSERLTRIIDGRDVASHGDREMPVWGDAFRATRGGLSEDAAKARIAAIVRYLQAIQERAAE